MNLFNFLPFIFFLCNLRMLRVKSPLCMWVCGERKREECGWLERRCLAKLPGQRGRPEETGVSWAPTPVQSDGGEEDGKKAQPTIKHMSVC